MRTTAHEKPFNKKKAKKELDTLWSLAVRRRDRFCRRCKKALSTQAAHIFSRGNLSTRWDVENGWGADYYCHIVWSHREPLEFSEWIKNELGEKNFNALKKKSQKIYDPSNFKADFPKIKETLKKLQA